MSCPLEDRVLLYGTGLLSAEENVHLERHARGCPRCFEALRLISRTGKILREAPLLSDPGETERIEHALIAWSGRRTRWRPIYTVFASAAAAAAAASIATFLLTRPTPQPPVTFERQTLHLEKGVKFRAGSAKVVAGSEAQLAFEPGPEMSLLSLEDGHVAIDAGELERAERFAVNTPEMHIEVLGATVQIKRDANGTAVYVDRGAVEIKARGETIALREGQKFVAQSVKTQAPALRVEVDAAELMKRADDARRSADSRRALEHYLRAADHPSGTAYREEALLRAARIEVALGHPERAEAELARAAAFAPHGTLLPERTALAASIAREAGKLDEAARLIEALTQNLRSISLAEERLAVARALAASDPTRARNLLTPLAEAGPGAAIRASAKKLIEEIEARR